MTLIFYIIIGFITFIAFLHAWARKEFDISRTVVINRSKEDVYNLVRQLKKESHWMPWFKKNYKGILKFNGEDGKQGALLYWRSKNRLFEGTQKIVKLNQGRIMETRVLVIRPAKMILLEYKGLKELDENKTKMVWGIRGGLNFPFSVIALFQPADKMYGEDLELGLKNLKTMLEYKNKKTEVD
ncbi:polyketide cyclase/dehydrase/lipid transport protein [Gillisia sp. Hel_I_86]|uniref:SRPBCC family protein n=1 Tax=Gillisia sp. Hel_I_86 TaxID=1249981 RepID=UPI00119B023D|nr:SRPBCC family protein [Gillisia sp. Hel_I_86]TVZ28147.1 polyketide cyclase/dehydrase/lipid transport protein [Gillisia sp. Hel_I_86]